LTREHELEASLEPELPTVRVDANTLAEVLYSLIDNATKYSRPGTRIRVTANRADGEMIVMTVEDEGRDIPVELRERVFDKFFHATSEGAAHAQRPKGLGMGLAIARGIVEAHGGRIWIENGAGGRGTRVAFTIPIGDEEPEPMEHSPAGEAAAHTQRANGPRP
jgi:two-component system sensor histidine kinase KdpD